MINGHGDDVFNYPDIRINFSSNVYNHFNHEPLFAHLARCLHSVKNYPEPSPVRVEQTVAAMLGISSRHVMVTSGATEAIYLVAQAFRGSRTAILSPTFAEYADACRVHGHRLCHVNGLAEWQGCSDMFWLCNPNNPTGTVLERDVLTDCIREHPDTVFVIDASYAPFTSEPLVSAAEAVALPNVVMIHSMTKEFAVPGLRIGYITAPETLTGRLRGLQMPWSVNSLAQEAALYLLAHRNQYALPLAALLQERERVAQALQQVGGIGVHPSDTHILLCRLLRGTAADLKQRLAQDHGILIRDASNFHGLTPAHFRIAVQTPAENDELVAAIKKTLSTGHDTCQ